MQSDGPKLSGLDHLVLTVSDLDATVAFYQDVLGMGVNKFRPEDGSQRVALTFGAQKINLHDAATPFAPHALRPAPGSADLCFLSDVPLADWAARFADMGVAVIGGPVSRAGATGPIISLYVRDPDGNLIEVANRV